jgi:hypothetical protein
MAKTSASTGIQVDVTQNYIDRCIVKHQEVLRNLLMSEHAPPSDGSIVKIIEAIDALQTRLIAKDDKAGRGSGKGYETE